MSSQTSNPEVLKTKHHFEILDGLRGVAALAIVVFHFMEVVYTDPNQNFIAHGFLAVDFFFCLSGFVIAFSYDDRIVKMGLGEFFKRRLIRLHPLVIFGSILGLLGFMFDPFIAQTATYSTAKMLLIFLSSLLLIPYPVMADRYFNLFGLNAPAWSLFWEYVANILYAFVLHKIAKRFLIALAVIAGLLLIYTAYKAGSLLGGWAGSNFWDGGARIFYSFLAGMLIYRCNWIVKTKLGFPGIAVLLMLAFLVPFKWGWISELTVVLFYFPLSVALGAGAMLSPKFKSICVFSGKISYPLYMTHYFAIWIFSNYYHTYKPNVHELAMVIVFGLILLIGFAYLIMHTIDIPIRKYLTHKKNKED